MQAAIIPRESALDVLVEKGFGLRVLFEKEGGGGINVGGGVKKGARTIEKKWSIKSDCRKRHEGKSKKVTERKVRAGPVMHVEETRLEASSRQKKPEKRRYALRNHVNQTGQRSGDA